MFESRAQAPTLSGHGSSRFTRTSIPNAYSFVPRGGDKEIWVLGMPAELIHAVSMSAERVVFGLVETKVDLSTGHVAYIHNYIYGVAVFADDPLGLQDMQSCKAGHFIGSKDI